MPVPSDPTILGFRLFCLQFGEIEFIEFNSGGNEQFKLDNLQVKVHMAGEELQMKIFVANYDFQMGSKQMAFYPEHDQTIDYGRSQTLFRESVKFSNFEKILWPCDLSSKISPESKFLAAHAMRGRRY